MKHIFLFTTLFFSYVSWGQVRLAYPLQNMVFQRNNFNEAQVPIRGAIGVYADRVEARLKSYNGFPATPKNWETIDSNPRNGLFSGYINAKGGWYELEIRVVFNNEVVAQTQLAPLGVGEVFVIAGQSNAEGNLDHPGAFRGTSESRVISLDFNDIEVREASLPYRFTPLTDFKKIGPYNPSPWIWATMAERIVAQEQVPVLLYGAAVGGTSSELWAGSSQGIDYSQSRGSLIKFYGSPYAVLRRTLQNYVSHTGARAILWQQGESDFRTNGNTYFERISTIIGQSRFDIAAEIPWFIAESSRTPFIAFQIIDAQRRLANQLSQTFAGPNTDVITGSSERYDGIHFSNGGIARAGNLWYEAIRTGNLLQRSNPVLAKPMVAFTTSCFNQNEIRLSISNPQLGASWSNNTTGRSVTLGSSPISASVRDNRGIRYPFPNIQLFPAQALNPMVTVKGSTSFCDGESTFLEANTLGNVSWNTGESSRQIEVNTAGNFFFSTSNTLGCTVFSNSQEVSILPKPSVQFIANSTVLCSGDTIVLGTNDKFQSYLWSTGERSSEIKITQGGPYKLQVENENGCKSDTASIAITELNRPTPPIISKQGYFGIQLAQQLSTDQIVTWQINDTPLAEFDNLELIKATIPGGYTSKITRAYQVDGSTYSCTSNQSQTIFIDEELLQQKIVAYPNPVRETLNIEFLENLTRAKIRLFDLKGTSLIEKIVEDTRSPISLNLSSLEQNIYLLEVISSGDVLRKKILTSL